MTRANFPKGLTLFEHELQMELPTPENPIPPPDPTPNPLKLDGTKLAIGASMLTAFAVLGVVWIGRKIKFRIQVGENKNTLENQVNLDQLKVEKNKNQFFFDDWD